MKVRIELDDRLADTELVIRVSRIDERIQKIQDALNEATAPAILFYKENSEYFVDLAEILFFETDGAKIFAHARNDAYEVKLKLYELEELLPRYSCRISKSKNNSRRRFFGFSRLDFASGKLWYSYVQF